MGVPGSQNVGLPFVCKTACVVYIYRHRVKPAINIAFEISC